MTQDRWVAQSAMSDPGEFRSLIDPLPCDIGSLNTTIQGLLVHLDWLSSYGLADDMAVSRQTLPVRERLLRILARDARPLAVPRPPEKREPATCRDFALMLCALLRSKHIPARLRCGFAAYLGGAWEDHWVCEYFDESAGRWQLADAQIDETLKVRCAVAFDPAHVPRDRFLTAGEAWHACRAGKGDPGHFGHGAAAGLWFMAVNVMRDHYVINNAETSQWDSWREADATHRSPDGLDLVFYDEIARAPEQPLKETEPFWL